MKHYFKTMILLTTTIVGITTTTNAQSVEPMLTSETTVGEMLRTETLYALGVQAGLTTGSGISFRASLPNRFAFELNAMYFSTGKPFWNIGGEVQYLLSNETNFKFYAMAGAGLFYSGTDISTNGLGQPFRFGIGPGFEYYIAPMAAIGAELPISAWVATNNTVVIPTPQVHFMYYFK